MGSQTELSGPDLGAGIAESDLRDTPLVGHAHGEAVLLVRDGRDVRAVGATCTHYGAPLADGIVVNGEVRCPWHHACFELATGRPRGPAIAPLPCWDVTVENGRIRVGARRTPAPAPVATPGRVVIVGAGAAGIACAETLRQEGYTGSITLVSAEGSDPVDRPNLSKDILAGTAPEDWAFLRTKDALRANDVAVVEGTADKLDVAGRRLHVGSRELPWDALLLATGADAVRLPIDGAQLPHVHTLRTLADTSAIARATTKGAPVVILGSSFIGLEAAASLRARGADVVVVGPDTTPLARVLGDEVGAFIRNVHEANGVGFRLGTKPASITPDSVILDDSTALPAAVVVMGVGVRPRLQLATDAGLRVDRGVVVDDELRAAPGVWVAGDIARYPWGGELVRIEHFQVAVRHGQAVARSMLGRRDRPSVPFFWSQHHDVTLAYVGHAERFDTPTIRGDLAARDAHVVYRTDGVIRAVVTLGRDRLALQVEEAMERNATSELEALVR